MPDHSTELRRFAPPAQRNREPIAEVLRGILPAEGTVLQIAEGSGEHVVYFAKAFPHLTFQPSDPDPQALASIAAWIEHEKLVNVLLPVQLDASADTWPVESANAVLCINMIHISPWAATEGLMHGAARLLDKGAPLFTYGPYKRNGEHTSDSNGDFDKSLRLRNAAWGIRDIAEVADCAGRYGFAEPEVIGMPANNFSLVFRRM